MEFFDTVRIRRSVRKFTSQKIAPGIMQSILRAIQSAPTAGNLQAYQVYLVESPDKIQALGKAAGDQTCVFGAPTVLVFCTDPPRSEVEYGERGRNLYCLLDAAIAATIGHLAAAAQGLGSVMVGAFEETEVARIIGAPPHQVPILMLPVGHPNEIPVPTSRRPLDDLVVNL